MLRVFCSMCTVTSEVDGAAIPRRCPSCNRQGYMTLARRTPLAEPDRTPLTTGMTIALRDWWGEYKRRRRLGLPQLEARTARQLALVEGRVPEPIRMRDD